MPTAVDLPDVNVWVALTLADHRHHDRVRQYWFEEANAELAFTRVTALGFKSLTTNPAATGGNPLTVGQAWEAYAALRHLPEVFLAAEPADTEEVLGQWALSEGTAPRLWTDAYLAAFARAAGFRLVTLDRDFQRFDRLTLLHLRA